MHLCLPCQLVLITLRLAHAVWYCSFQPHTSSQLITFAAQPLHQCTPVLYPCPRCFLVPPPSQGSYSSPSSLSIPPLSQLWMPPPFQQVKSSPWSFSFSFPHMKTLLLPSSHLNLSPELPLPHSIFGSELTIKIHLPTDFLLPFLPNLSFHPWCQPPLSSASLSLSILSSLHVTIYSLSSSQFVFYSFC